MLADEIDAPGPPKVVSRGRVQIWTFWATLGLWAADLPIFVAIAWWWRARPPILLLMFLSGTNAILAKVAVGAWLRRSGRTVEGAPTVEAWTRAPDAPPAGATGESVEVRVPFGLCLGFGLLNWTLAAVFGLVLVASPPESGRMGEMEWACLGLIAFGLLGGTWLIVVVGVLAKPVRADDAGVWAYPRDLAIRRRFVPWSAIGGIEVSRYADVRGRSIAALPVLLGHHGERLMRVDLTLVPLAEHRRLVDFLLARFPEPAKPAKGDAPPDRFDAGLAALIARLPRWAGAGRAEGPAGSRPPARALTATPGSL